MGRPIPATHATLSPIPLAIGLFVSVTLLVALCAKHARRRVRQKTTSSDTSEPNMPKNKHKTITTIISHKALLPLLSAKKAGPQQETGDNEESGLWQKAILMGEKCQPPEFSGVIYYDYSGNRISEMPMSPRASPMRSPLRNFTFPVAKAHENSMY